jgi:hypothetical protein
MTPEELYGPSISAIPQNRFLGGMANFMKFLEKEKPEFLPESLDVMGLMRQLALPSSQTIENLSYGNSPFTMPPQGTGSMIPQVKTGRKPEVADLIGLISGGVPGAKPVLDVGQKLSTDAMNAYMKMIRETPPIGAINPSAAMPPVPQKSELGFYSALEQAAMPLQNKGTGSQYLAQLQKTPGVKPEELKWTGLEGFLGSRQNVTKQEIQDYLAANRVDLQEVRLGENGLYTQWKQNLDAAKQSQEAAKINMELTLPDNFADINYYNVRDMWAAPAAKGDPTALGKIRFLGLSPEQEANILDYGRQVNRVIDLKSSQPINTSTKFSQYTTPGGENYREILLTLPQKNPEFDPADLGRLTELSNKTRTAAETEEYRKLAQRYDASLRGETTPEYRSTHFNQPNILAHMRVNDRVVDGKKTLFIEEVQSDWHQAGRKRGYQDPAQQQALADEIKNLGITKPIKDVSIFDLQKVGASDDLINRFDNVMLKTSGGVPDAPFKTTWHELALKRAIQEASEKGYDKIAFTTGQTQAARYDLSKQVDTIAYRPTGDGKFEVSAIKDGNSVMTEYGKTAEDLESLVGKDLAKKIANGEGALAEGFRGEKGGVRELSGIDLQVGGEGMKGFYDNILPKSLNNLGKKFDAKVSKSKLDGGDEVWTMDITPKMRESVTTKGQPLFQFAPAIPAAGLLDYEER